MYVASNMMECFSIKVGMAYNFTNNFLNSHIA